MQEISDQPLFQLHDNELADLTRAGDQAALAEITKRYRPRLYDTALAMLFSPPAAEKAVEHTLQELQSSLDDFKHDSLFLTWICRRLIKYILNEYSQTARQDGSANSSTLEPQ